MPTLDRWRATWAGLGLMSPERLHDEVCRRYGEAHRAYHTLRHLAECFEHFDGARHLARRPSEVELALWFHDAIHDPRAADSEDRSAEWARLSLVSAGASDDVVARVSDLILATRHATHEVSADHAVLLDTDLSILGAPVPRFLEYESQVRQEYSWVPEEAFRKARSAILERFLERPRIYATDHFARALEVKARSNLRNSIERLGVEPA